MDNDEIQITDFTEFTLPPGERYCSPTLNEVKFISDKQTLSLVLGSCISTVIIGRGKEYILAANHIVIANPHRESKVARKGALQQINEMLYVFKNLYNIEEKDLICFHLVGAGNKQGSNKFQVNLTNIEETSKILKEKKLLTVFNDTESYYVTKYSLGGENMSVFIENKFRSEHLSFIVDLKKLFRIDPLIKPRLPISSIDQSKEFEYLIDENVIVFITGDKNRFS